MPEQPFGLNENPFADGHDRRFLYPSFKRLEAVALLRKRIADGESFVTVTGESGSGKTSVVTELLEDGALKTKVAFVAHPSLTPSELLEAVCIEFGAPLPGTQSKPQTLAALEHFLRDLKKRGMAPVLVLDEAHGLKTELLEEARLLSNMKADGRALLQTILVGLPELERRLGLPELAQLRQRIGVHARVVPLDREETEGYLQHRVSAAGGNGPAIMTPEACHEIYDYTNGLPRDINTLAGRALECAQVDGADAVTAEHVRTAAGDARPRGIATSARAASPGQPFELRRKVSVARAVPEAARTSARPPAQTPERPPDREASPAPPRPAVAEAQKPPSFLRAQQTARAGDATPPQSPALDPARETLEERFRRGEITALELAAEKNALAGRQQDRAGGLGAESVRELGASVLLVGVLVVVLIATGRWDPVTPAPEPPGADPSTPTRSVEAPSRPAEGERTHTAGARIETPIEKPVVTPAAPRQSEPREAPGTGTPDLTLGAGRGTLRGIAFEVASSAYPDSAAMALRKIMRGSKLPCRIVTKTSGDPYRVVVGPFQTRREAEKAITELFRHALVERARIVQLVE